MRIVTRDDLTAWLDGLTGSATLIAPKAVEEQILYKPVAGSLEIAFGFTKTDLSPKEHFLPPTHLLLSIAKGEGGIVVEEPPELGEQVLFGVRPCDAKALRALDALFMRGNIVQNSIKNTSALAGLDEVYVQFIKLYWKFIKCFVQRATGLDFSSDFVNHGAHSRVPDAPGNDLEGGDERNTRFEHSGQLPAENRNIFRRYPATSSSEQWLGFLFNANRRYTLTP